MEILTVISKTEGTDKRKKSYKRIEFSTPSFILQGGVKIKIEPQTQIVIKYPISYLPSGAPDFGHDFEVNDKIAGTIVKKGGLYPYPIMSADGKTVERTPTVASHVVLGNSDDVEAWKVAVDKEFASRGKFLVSDPLGAQRYAEYWETDPETGEVKETQEEQVETATLETA